MNVKFKAGDKARYGDGCNAVDGIVLAVYKKLSALPHESNSSTEFGEFFDVVVVFRAEIGHDFNLSQDELTIVEGK